MAGPKETPWVPSRVFLTSVGALLGSTGFAAAAVPAFAETVLTASLLGALAGSLAGAAGVVLLSRRVRGQRLPGLTEDDRAAHAIRNKVTSLGLALDTFEARLEEAGSPAEVSERLRMMMRDDLDRLAEIACELGHERPDPR